MEDTTKNIIVNIDNKEKPKKRLITSNAKWKFNDNELTSCHEENILKQIYTKNIINKEQCEFFIHLINKKISGYRYQDIEKHKLDTHKFITLDKIIELMIECENICYYCKNNVKILYEFVRETTQWTLDRIDNNLGHNNDNVMIACLNCNLRRRTMYHERYAFTKQLVIKKM